MTAVRACLYVRLRAPVAVKVIRRGVGDGEEGGRE
jgi:hypothetical protein